MTLDDRYLPVLAATDRGEFTYSASTINGYQQHGVQCDYLTHSRLSWLELNGYVAYDESTDWAPIKLTDKGREALR